MDFAKANNINLFFETSAKTGSNVENVFCLAGKQIHNVVKARELES